MILRIDVFSTQNLVRASRALVYCSPTYCVRRCPVTSSAVIGARFRKRTLLAIIKLATHQELSTPFYISLFLFLLPA